MRISVSEERSEPLSLDWIGRSHQVVNKINENNNKKIEKEDIFLMNDN